MEDWKSRLFAEVSRLENDIERLFASQAVLFAEVDPPENPGVYIIYDHDNRLSYIGEAAKGAGGLKDRLKKHLSGDTTHAAHRHYKEEFPDKRERRKFIEQNVQVKWVATRDASDAIDVERLLICAYKPAWNKR